MNQRHSFSLACVNRREYQSLTHPKVYDCDRLFVLVSFDEAGHSLLMTRIFFNGFLSLFAFGCLQQTPAEDHRLLRSTEDEVSSVTLPTCSTNGFFVAVRRAFVEEGVLNVEKAVINLGSSGSFVGSPGLMIGEHHHAQGFYGLLPGDWGAAQVKFETQSLEKLNIGDEFRFHGSATLLGSEENRNESISSVNEILMRRTENGDFLPISHGCEGVLTLGSRAFLAEDDRTLTLSRPGVVAFGKRIEEDAIVEVRFVVSSESGRTIGEFVFSPESFENDFPQDAGKQVLSLPRGMNLDVGEKIKLRSFVEVDGVSIPSNDATIEIGAK